MSQPKAPPSLEELAKMYDINIKGPDFKEVKNREDAEKEIGNWYREQRINLQLAHSTSPHKTGIDLLKGRVESRYGTLREKIEEFFPSSKIDWL